jgi:S1-C subfamily serine protease
VNERLEDQSSLRLAYQLGRTCMTHIVSRTSEGDLTNGSGFHIGDGYIATARHVAASDVTEVSVAATGQPLRIRSTILNDDENVDVALLATDLVQDEHIILDDVVDGAIVEEDLVLSKVVLLGYPPIPMARSDYLVAATGEISAVVRKYTPHSFPHLIISSMPRGGFSGGPVLSFEGRLVGLLTESLHDDPEEATELGFNAALTVERIWTLLQERDIYPGGNALFLRYLAGTLPLGEYLDERDRRRSRERAS